MSLNIPPNEHGEVNNNYHKSNKNISHGAECWTRCHSATNHPVWLIIYHKLKKHRQHFPLYAEAYALGFLNLLTEKKNLITDLKKYLMVQLSLSIRKCLRYFKCFEEYQANCHISPLGSQLTFQRDTLRHLVKNKMSMVISIMLYYCNRRLWEKVYGQWFQPIQLEMFWLPMS